MGQRRRWELDPAAIDLTDPDTNIHIGCWYLSWLNEKFGGVSETVLAGYNAGHGSVARWLADEEMSWDGITLDEIPYEETKSYVKRVKLAEQAYRLRLRLASVSGGNSAWCVCRQNCGFGRK